LFARLDLVSLPRGARVVSFASYWRLQLWFRAFELSEPPLVAGYYHCTWCQRRTGTAASPSAAVKAETFRIVGGEDRVRRWNAGDGNDKAFCGACGSALFSENPDDREIIFVRMGLFDGDPGVRPSVRVHVASAAV
jgi:hypothetical protein